MAKERMISTHFWDDTYIVELDPIEKLLFLYLLTTPCTDIGGAYEINLRRIALDTGIDREMILKILDRFATAQKITFKDGWILIHNFIKNQRKNPSVIKGINRSLNNCPDWIKDRLLQTGKSLPQAVLLNLTKPNLTERDKGSIVKAEVQNTFAPLNSAVDQEVKTWLAAIAAAVGAKDARSLSKFQKWESVCKTAIRENLSLERMLVTIEAEMQRNKGKEHFFSPDTVLQKLQMNSHITSKWHHEVPQ